MQRFGPPTHTTSLCLPSHGLAQRIRRAHRHGRGHRRSGDPRLSRRRGGRRTHPGPACVGPRAQPSCVRPPRRPSPTEGGATAAEHAEMIMGGTRWGPPSSASTTERQVAANRIQEARRWPRKDRCTSLGPSPIVNSDSQGMGRIGETVRRTFQLADAMKTWRASDLGADWPDAPAITGTPGPETARGRRARRQRTRAALPRQGGPRNRRSYTASAMRSAPYCRDGWRTSFSGRRAGSAFTPSSSSRRATSQPGGRWAKATHRCTGRSRRATGRDWGGVGRPRRRRAP